MADNEPSEGVEERVAAAGWTDAERRMARTEVTLPSAPELGLAGAPALLLVLGAVLIVLAGLFNTINGTSDDYSDGLGDTATWFQWFGAVGVSLGLLLAGLLGRALHPGGRVAFVAVGALLLMGTTDSAVNVVGNMFSGFAGAFGP